MVDWKASDQGKNLRDTLLEDHRRGYELVLLIIIWVSLALTLAGAGLVSVSTFQTYLTEGLAQEIGIWLTVAGVILVSISEVMSFAIRRLRIWFMKESGGDRYDKMRRWTRIKVGSVLLQLLVIVGLLVLGAAVMALLDGFEPDDVALITKFTVLQVPTTLVTVTVAVLTWIHVLTLRTPTEHQRMGLESIFLSLSIAATVLLAIISGVLTSSPLNLPGLPEFSASDAPFFLLASSLAAIGGLFICRGLPSVAALVTEEHAYYRGRSHMTRTKSVVLPISIAFVILLLVVLAMVFFQLSLVSTVEEISTNAVVLGFVGFIVAALVASLVATILLSRTEEEHTLFRTKRTRQERVEITILAVSLSITAVLLASAAVLFIRGDLPGLDVSKERWLDFLAFGLLSALGPYGFYHRRKAARIRQLEARFPDFLRDLAASRKAGLTLTNSVMIAARGEYGALTPDIQKMADQLAWNVPFAEALDQFGERVNTPLVQRAVSLINEASRSGGQVTDVLEAAARDAREIKNLEDDRRLTMTLYTAIVYIAFLVFLGVAATLFGTFIPEILRASQAAAASAGGGAGFGGLQFGSLSLIDYRTFYFIASLSQAVGNGAIAGLMESGDAKNGMLHSFVMVVITYFVFTLVL